MSTDKHAAPRVAPPAPDAPPDGQDAAYRQLYAVVEDLKKVLRERDQALAAARAADRAKTAFLANMSDALLAPLTTIIGFAELALADAETADQRDRLTRVLKAARQLQSVVDQLLALSRLEA